MNNYFYVENAHTYGNFAMFNLALDFTTSSYEFDAADGKLYIPFFVRLNLGNFRRWFDDDLQPTKRYAADHALGGHYYDWLNKEIKDFTVDITGADISLNINNKKGCTPTMTNLPLTLNIDADNHIFKQSLWYKMKIDSACWLTSKQNEINYQISIDHAYTIMYLVNDRSYGTIDINQFALSEEKNHDFEAPGIERYVNYVPKGNEFAQEQLLYYANCHYLPGKFVDNTLVSLFSYQLTFVLNNDWIEEYDPEQLSSNLTALKIMIPSTFDKVKTKSEITASEGEYSFKNIDGVLKYDQSKQIIKQQVTTNSSFDPVGRKINLTDWGTGIGVDWFIQDENVKISTTINGVLSQPIREDYTNKDEAFNINTMSIEMPTSREIDNRVLQAIDRFCFIDTIFIGYFNADMDLTLYKQFCKDFKING